MKKSLYICTIKHFTLNKVLVAAISLSAASCAMNDGYTMLEEASETKNVGFDIVITKDGQMMTKGQMDQMDYNEYLSVADGTAHLDPGIPFGLVGVDRETSSVVINNEEVYERNGARSMSFSTKGYDTDRNLLLSAYYPHVDNIDYLDNNAAYGVPYFINDTQAGPLVSQTVEKRMSYLNVVPLVFRHITNDVGFKVCDITRDERLRGKIHIRKLIAHNVAQEGYYVDTLGTNGGLWRGQSFYRDITVFDGDCPVGIGTKNELYVGSHNLVNEKDAGNRFYSIPDEIKMGKQYVEVIFDVDGFELDGARYSPLKNQVQKFPIYGVLPDNQCVYGKQYTFHLGLDLNTIYQTIEFTASVDGWDEAYSAELGSGWESKIYEDNDFF